MNLGEAINYLQTEADLAQRQPETGVYDAIKLGIEALKAIRRYRIGIIPQWVNQLPGETKE